MAQRGKAATQSGIDHGWHGLHGYRSSQVPESIRPFYFLNPMAGVVEGFRWALIDAAPRPGPVTLLSAAIMLLLLIGGLFYFRSAERSFADVI